MPTVYSYSHDKSVKDNIEAAQKALKSAAFSDPEQYSEESRIALYTSVFAGRMSANAVRGKKRSLKVTPEESDYQENYELLKKSGAFAAFLKDRGEDEIKRLLTEGHGGAAEDSFQEYLLSQPTLPVDAPDRYMPTAKARIEAQQQKLVGLDPFSDAAAEIYADIFRCRRTVNAVRGKGGGLEITVRDEDYGKALNVKDNKVFKSFVQDRGPELKLAAGQGHGGAAEDLFKTYLLEMDHIPAEAPTDYMPTALDRTEALQKRLKNDDSPVLYTELIATREAVKAERGKKDSLDHAIDPAALTAAYDKWHKCKTFQDFLREKPAAAAAAAAAGHGGALEDAFKRHVLTMEHIPDDVPESCMPDGLTRLEALREKYRSQDFNVNYAADQDKLRLAAELMATRETVEAVRGQKSSLEKPIDPKKLNENYTKWAGCKAFREFVTDPENAAIVRTAGSTGHGGSMEDRFKEYLLRRPTLEEDIPNGYMPNGLARVEALQRMVENNEGNRKQLITELVATRNALQAERGNRKSLDKTIDTTALKAEREKLEQSATFQSFLENEEMAERLRTSALAGHGGALDDLFKEHILTMDHIPPDVPQASMPKALPRTEALRRRIAAEAGKAEPDLDQLARLSAELLATRRAVDAVRGDKTSLDKNINPKTLDDNYKALSESDCFKDYIRNNRIQAVAAATAGHGGALEDRFREHVTSLKTLPENVPAHFMPNGRARIEGIQKALRSDAQMSLEDKTLFYAQLLATRHNVGAVRKDKSSLEKRLDPAAVNAEANTLANCEAFKNYVTDHADEVSHAALSGHGGELEDKFREYVKSADRLPEDLPANYVPTALARTEALQKKIGSNEFAEKSSEEKAAVYAQLIAARRAVGAVRGNKDSLNVRIPVATAAAEAKKLTDCQTFKDFIAANPAAVSSAARSGHGGALQDKFKEYVLNLDRIPQDVPKEYMPTALERTEVLQDKIKSRAFSGKSQFDQNELYRELAATRAAVNSVRGEKASLKVTVDPVKLHEARQALSEGACDDYFENANRQQMLAGAKDGHGGLLEDKLREHLLKKSVTEGVLPNMPKRLMPTTTQLKNELKKSLTQELRINPNPNFANNRELTMKKVASMMYLTKLEWEGGKLDPESMQRSVNALMNSQSFRNMFNAEGAPRQITQSVSSGRMSEVFTRFGQNGGNQQQIMQQQPVPQIQVQQPVVNQENQIGQRGIGPA